jgi:hypothetical protein
MEPMDNDKLPPDHLGAALSTIYKPPSPGLSTGVPQVKRSDTPPVASSSGLNFHRLQASHT